MLLSDLGAEPRHLSLHSRTFNKDFQSEHASHSYFPYGIVGKMSRELFRTPFFQEKKVYTRPYKASIVIPAQEHPGSMSVSGMRVNSDLGAGRQRPARASDLSSAQDGPEGHLGSHRHTDPQGISPCSQPTPYTLLEAKHTGSEEPHWSVPQGAPEA